MRSSLVVLLTASLLSFGCQARAAAIDRTIPAPAVDIAAQKSGLQKAVLAGGCFWGLQGMYQHVKGVTRVVSGYSGGTRETATYEQVSTEQTGHAESIEITYDPKQITYGQLLQLYFSVAHDPTQLNRQDPDQGPSYRSQIFYGSAEEQRIATAYVKQLNDAKIFHAPIVTRIEPLKAFYAAEDYHQDFLLQHPTHPYIARFDQPKIVALKRLYPSLYREQAVRTKL